MSESSAQTVRVGVISDTHKQLPKRAVEALAGVDAIVHAGDVGSRDVLYELMGIAPVTAVRGNTDHELPGFHLPSIAQATFGGKRLLAVHNIKTLGPVPDGVQIVVYGHTHRANVATTDGVLYVNPGSAGHHRDEADSVAIIEIPADGEPQARIVRY